MGAFDLGARVVHFPPLRPARPAPDQRAAVVPDCCTIPPRV